MRLSGKVILSFALMVVSSLGASLALACPSDRLCTGDRMVDSSNYVGTVLDVYSNGKAKVRIDAYSGTYIRSINDLGKGTKCNQHICVNDRIVDSLNYVGSALEVFDNGKVKVRLDGYSGTSIRRVSELGKGYRCIENVCKGDGMIDSSNYTGKIRELFDNAKAKVTLDGYSGTYVRTFSDLGIELKCKLRENCSCRK